MPRLRRDSSPSCEETARGIPEFRILLRDFATGSNGKVETPRRFSIRRLRARLRERERFLKFMENGRWRIGNSRFAKGDVPFESLRCATDGASSKNMKIYRLTDKFWTLASERPENPTNLNSASTDLIAVLGKGSSRRVVRFLFSNTTKTFSKTRILCGFGSEGGRGAHREWPSLECTRAHNDLHAHVPRIAPYREGNGSPVGCTQRN